MMITANVLFTLLKVLFDHNLMGWSRFHVLRCQQTPHYCGYESKHPRITFVKGDRKRSSHELGRIRQHSPLQTHLCPDVRLYQCHSGPKPNGHTMRTNESKHNYNNIYTFFQVCENVPQAVFGVGGVRSHPSCHPGAKIKGYWQC